MDHARPNDTNTAPRSILGRQHPLQLLPLDVLFLIIDRLTPVEFINFAFASYPMLLQHNLVPTIAPCYLSAFTLHVYHLNRRPRPSAINGPTAASATNNGQTQSRTPRSFPLPAELLIHIMHCLAPIDKMSLVLANYGDLKDAGIAPEMTKATFGALGIAAGRAGKGAPTGQHVSGAS